MNEVNELEAKEREACAQILTAIILQIADIFIAKGKSRKRALILAADVVGESSKEIANALI